MGSSATAIVAGLMAASHLLGLDADVPALATEIEGHPDNVAAAVHGGFVVCADGEVTRLDVPAGLEAVAVVPRDGGSGGEANASQAPDARRHVSTAMARQALPPEVPVGDAVFNIAHGALLTLGLATGDWELVSRGLRDRIHQDRRGGLYPRSHALLDRVSELGALGGTLSGAGPTVLVWCLYEQTGKVVEALRAEVDGWASVMRVPFEPQGAHLAPPQGS
jgi:homoserine kinase